MLKKLFAIAIFTASYIFSSDSQDEAYLKNVLPLKEGLREFEEYTAPFVASLYCGEQKKICYMGTKHSNISSANFSAQVQNFFIAQQMDQFKPDVVILEGYLPNTSSDDATEHADTLLYRAIKNSSDPTESENVFALNLACTLGNITPVTGEPDRQTLIKGMTELTKRECIDKISSEQAEAYVITTLLLANSFEHLFPNSAAYFSEENFNELLKIVIGDMETNYSFRNFWDHLSTHYNIQQGQCFDSNELFADYPDKFFAKIFGIMTKIRDLNIIKQIAKYSSEGKKVMVVYGAAHYFTQKLAIEESLSITKMSVFQAKDVSSFSDITKVIRFWREYYFAEKPITVQTYMNNRQKKPVQNLMYSAICGLGKAIWLSYL